MNSAVRYIVLALTAFSGITVSARGGILKSLDGELSSIIGRVEPFLVTVKGEGDWRNLIATGIVYSEDGYVITSSHVYGADKFQIIFTDGRSYSAVKIGVDNDTGLAVLKISGQFDFRGPRWSKSTDLKNGSWIMVVGNSYNDPVRVNFGNFMGNTNDGFLRLGIDVNPGSSGGAVLNTDGDVIGILVARESASGLPMDNSRQIKEITDGFMSNGFFKSGEKALAVPVEIIPDIVDQLIKTGKVNRGFLGISQKNLTKDELEKYGIESGIKVISVVDDSPAQAAGLREEDIIISVHGEIIRDTAVLYARVRSHKPGDRIKIRYLRDGEYREGEAVLANSTDEFLIGGLKIPRSLRQLELSRVPDLSEIDKLKAEVAVLKKELARLGKEMEKSGKEPENPR